MVLGAILGIGSSIFGASQQSSAASKANKEAKKAQKAQHQYNKSAWRMGKQRLNADRDFAIEGIEIAKRNEKTLADLKDNVALDNYEYSLKIRQQQMQQNVKQFEKSYELFNQQNTFNDLAANNAKTSAQNKFNEQLKQAAFQNQGMIIESLQQQGAIEARGVSGNSAGRLATNAIGALGRNQAIIQAQLLSGNKAMEGEYRTINQQKFGADIQAFSNLLIPADEPLMPPDPRQTPLSEYQMPRELEDFDYGPEPVKGAVATYNASAPWINALNSGVQTIASMFTNQGPPMSYGGGNIGSSAFNFSGSFGGLTQSFGSGSSWSPISSSSGFNLNQSFF